MVDGGSNNRQSERDINGMSETAVFEHRQALIVIHGDDCIDALQRLFSERRVCRQRALNQMAKALKPGNNRRNDVNFLSTKVPIFASMGVESTDADAWLGNAKVFTERA